MFVLGIIILVLETAVGFLEAQSLFFNADNAWSQYRINVTIATFSRLMVRRHDGPYRLLHLTDGCSVYSKRYYLRLARSGSLEQRQTRRRHSSALHLRDCRYIEMGSFLIVILCSSGTHISAAIVCDLVLTIAPFESPAYHSIQFEQLGERVLIWVGPTLGTNLLSTGLIAWKFW